MVDTTASIGGKTSEDPFDSSDGSLFASDDSRRGLDNSNNNENASATNDENERIIAQAETKVVKRLRIAVLLILIGAAASVCGATYWFTKRNELNAFHVAFKYQATKVVDAFQINAMTRVNAIEAFSQEITSHAIFSNSTWPFVTLPEYERRGSATSSLAQVMSTILVPIVTDRTRDAWETYSVANQGWFTEGLAVQQTEEEEEEEEEEEVESNSHSSSHSIQDPTIRTLIDEEMQQNDFNDPRLRIPKKIYRVKGLKAARELGPGPYLPQWQIAPAIPIPSLVNFNLLSHGGYQDSLTALLKAQVTILGRSFDFSDPRDEQTAGRRDIFNQFLYAWNDNTTNTYDNPDPVADIFVPVFDHLNKTKTTRSMVGLLTCAIYWKTFFHDILSERVRGIVVVLKNTCNQQYTYAINGVEAIYVGPGDSHDERYDSFETIANKDTFLILNHDHYVKEDVVGACHYSIHVYPSQTFEEQYTTSKPILYTCVLIIVFSISSSTFITYDLLVQRRQRIVMDAAVASDAIVSSLFPKEVLDRLYQDKRGSMTRRDSNEETKQMNTGDSETPIRPPSRTESQGLGTTQRQIADLYKDCTVLFADIVGFTSWSSTREPDDVFLLLEKLYGTFDTIARKRRVFKVETIGDSYLAVTGLPERQEDHAVRMSLFAYECLRQFRFLISRELPDLLGAGTNALSLRFGLHSGPVTGGILRGERSHFQLFGDTVNTAARIESTGISGRIHLSQQTRDCLVSVGKACWCDEREHMVTAKGKGKLKTYWLRIRKNKIQSLCDEEEALRSPDKVQMEELDNNHVSLSTSFGDLRSSVASRAALEELYKSIQLEDDDDEEISTIEDGSEGDHLNELKAMEELYSSLRLSRHG